MKWAGDNFWFDRCSRITLDVKLWDWTVHPSLPLFSLRYVIWVSFSELIFCWFREVLKYFPHADIDLDGVESELRLTIFAFAS